MAFCKWCGKSISENIKFCANCGKLNSNFKELNEEKLETVIEESIIEEEKNKEDIVENKAGIKLKLEKENLDKSSVEESNKQNKQAIEDKQTKSRGIKEKPERKNKSKKMIIVSGVLGCALIGGILIYCFYDDFLYSKYTKAIQSTTNIGEKFSNYDKIISLGKYEEIKKPMLGLIAVDISYLNYVENMENISIEEKNDIMKASLVALAEERYLEGEFLAAKNALDRASKYGYSISDEFYKRIEDKLGNDSGNIGIEAEQDTIVKNTDFYIDDSHLRYLEEAELVGYDKDQLAIIRNEIYARHGYVFHQEPFKSYFNKQKWYTSNPGFKGSDGELNSYEKENVQLLLKLEKER